MNDASIHTAYVDSSHANNRLRPMMLAGMLCLLTLLAYFTSFQGVFLYDDGLCILEHPAIDEWWPDDGKLTTGKRRWFTHFTLVANYKLHGFRVFGYHVVNWVIHLTGGFLLFGLVRRTLLLPALRQRYEHSASMLAFAVAAIWLLHPLQTESVTYIVQRLESLAGLFFLLTLYALLRGSQAQRAWPWYGLMLVAIYLGFGTKETMFVAPLVAVVFDRIFLASSRRELIQQRGWVYLAMLPALTWAGILLRYSFMPGTKTAMGFAIKDVSPWEYLRSQPSVIMHYLKLTFWPSGQCLDYWWRIEQDPWRIYGLGAVIVGLLALTLAALIYRPRLGFLGLAFFVILAPTSSFMPIRDLAFEHRMYLPLAALVTLVVLACDALFRITLREHWLGRAVSVALLSLVVIVLALVTAERNRVYHDPVVMWQDIVNKSPHNDRAYYNLGKAIANRAMAGSPERYRTLCLNNAPALDKEASTGGTLSFTDDLRRAVECLERSLRIAPKQTSAHFNIGGIYDRTGQPELAMAAYQRELKNNPTHLNARLNLAHLLAKQDQLDEAGRHTREAARLHPQDHRSQVQLGILLAQQGQTAEAIACYRHALELRPDSVSAKCRLALAQWELGEERTAITALRELRRSHRQHLDVNLALARFIATTSEADLRHPEEGAVIAQQVIDHSGAKLSEAWETLALCLASMQCYDDAIAKLNEALELAHANGLSAKHGELRELRDQWRALVSDQETP